MGISINEINSSTALKIDGNIYFVQDYNHVKPGKGSAFVRVKLRNIKTSQVLERTFKSSETLDDVPLEEKKMQCLYQSGDTYHFMDLSSYEQIEIPSKLIGDNARFLKENAEVIAITNGHEVLKVELPNFIVCEITESEPGIKGDSSKSSGKPAKLDTGATILVPLFINQGDWIKVDTRSGTYVERVQR